MLELSSIVHGPSLTANIPVEKGGGRVTLYAPFPFSTRLLFKSPDFIQSLVK